MRHCKVVRRGSLLALLSTLTLFATSACSSLLDVQTQQGQVDPTLINSYSGAVDLYGGVLRQLAGTYAGSSNVTSSLFFSTNTVVVNTGLLTDELHMSNLSSQALTMVDGRLLTSASSGGTSIYTQLQALRVLAMRAAGLLRQYPAQASPDLIGQMYAVEGYAEVMLAESHCSGIPLTTVPPAGGSLTYTAGFTTAQVLTQAVAHFDSALTFATDSARIVTLARVGKGRALLDLGDYANAATAVAAVQTGDLYNVEYSTNPQSVTNGVLMPSIGVSTVDGEGGNGLAWRAANDPRATFTQVGGVWYATRYTAANTPVPLATGIEARLIEAEAQLHAGDATWLATLNALRTNGVSNVSGTDTTWSAGTGGVAGLRPLTDPGSDTARVTLLFRERAFWLFLTGHRQGDLRRLIRQYARPALLVFPSGLYTPASTTVSAYGTSVVFPVPDAEAQNNPLYTGCTDLNA
jgi:hypothetical protein